jgi:hypothetical protein
MRLKLKRTEKTRFNFLSCKKNAHIWLLKLAPCWLLKAHVNFKSSRKLFKLFLCLETCSSKCVSHTTFPNYHTGIISTKKKLTITQTVCKLNQSYNCIFYLNKLIFSSWCTLCSKKFILFPVQKTFCSSLTNTIIATHKIQTLTAKHATLTLSKCASYVQTNFLQTTMFSKTLTWTFY